MVNDLIHKFLALLYDFDVKVILQNTQEIHKPLMVDLMKYGLVLNLYVTQIYRR